MVTGNAPSIGDPPCRATARQAHQEVMSSILEKEPSLLTNYIARASAEFSMISKTLRKDRDNAIVTCASRFRR